MIEDLVVGASWLNENYCKQHSFQAHYLAAKDDFKDDSKIIYLSQVKDVNEQCHYLGCEKIIGKD